MTTSLLTVLRVVSENEKWVVSSEDGPLGIFDDQEDAVVFACEKAYGIDCDVHIYDVEGTLTTIMAAAPAGQTASGFSMSIVQLNPEL